VLRRFTNTTLQLAAATVALALLVGCGTGPAPVNQGGPPAKVPVGNLPPELQPLVRQANRLLDGDTDAFEAQLKALRGYPMVVNEWASWCPPCRYEFPFLQHLTAKYQGSVDFLGVNSQDERGDAQDFLQEFPVPFPHYYDKDASLARVLGDGRAWPTTAFYNADGKLVKTHLAGYAGEAKLDADIRRYALNG
jgi:cytochrome c biogenesis protein CcmG/thiol:disulfide interchange protein DsbE